MPEPTQNTDRPDVDDPVLYVSPRTEENLGAHTVNKLTEWANVEKGLLVIDKHDFGDFLESQIRGLDLSDNKDLQDALAYSASRKAELFNSYLERFPGVPLSTFLEQDTTLASHREYFDNILTGRAGGLGFSLSHQAERPEFGVLVTDSEETAIEIGSQLSGLPPSRMGHIQFNEFDARALKAIHEAAHIRFHHKTEPYPVKTFNDFIGQEVEADQYALNEFVKEYNEGGYGFEAAREFESLRALGAVHYTVQSLPARPSTHLSSASYDVEDDEILTNRFNEASLIGGAGNVGADLTNIVGAVMGETLLQDYNIRLSFGLARGYHNLDDARTISEENRDAFVADKIWRERYEILEHHDEVQQLSRIAMANDPDLVYAAASYLGETGQYPSSSAESEILKEYISAYERFSPYADSADTVQEFRRRVSLQQSEDTTSTPQNSTPKDTVAPDTSGLNY